MERKCQNLEFIVDLSEPSKSNESSRRPSRCLLIPNNPVQYSYSGGDIGSAMRQVDLDADDTSTYSEDVFEGTEDGGMPKSSNENDESHVIDVNITPKRQSLGSNLQEELLKYKQELRDYTSTTKDLKDEYLQINCELSDIQQKHNQFVAERNGATAEYESFSDTSLTGSEFSLQRKYTQVFHRGNSFLHVVPPTRADTSSIPEEQSPTNADEYLHNRKDTKLLENKRGIRRCSSGSKENVTPALQSKKFRDIYKAIQACIDVDAKQHLAPNRQDVSVLQTTINNLQTEQRRFRIIIEQQQQSLLDYRTRCIKAQHTMKSQQAEIQNLNANNRQLETEITDSMNQLRHKIEGKLREVAQLPQLMRDEQTKSERALRENSLLNERIRTMQAEATALKIKMEEVTRRKTSTINRLKASERDLKIFKNYNAALKHEKRQLSEQLQKMREQLGGLQNSNKRTMNRQRELSEKQRRELQKRVFELEMKLNRNQSSTTSLLQERDSLITELQTQLNTLVHNFEVSQKHIRVLRRHIYTMSSGSPRDAVARNRVLDETA